MVRSLQQRLTLFLLLPTALLLLGMGFGGFLYARGIMLDQWRESAILKLERAAHHIDMRLERPMIWIEALKGGTDLPNPYRFQEWLVGQLKGLEGVRDAELNWAEDSDPSAPAASMERGMRGGMGMSMMRFRSARISTVTSPQYDAKRGEETVALISNLVDEQGKSVGRVRLTLSFEYLMQDIRELGWWQSDRACIMDMSGKCLATTEAMKGRGGKLIQSESSLEAAILKAMKKADFGTILGPGPGPGRPPEQVGGFYKIKQAPWAIVLIAPGNEILAPIIRFRLYYGVAGLFLIIVILLLIRLVAGNMARSIGVLSRAAERVADGNYGDPLPVRTGDEIGHLTGSFNEMVKGLKERDFISNTFGRYVDQEIARELMLRPDASRLGGEKRDVAILMSDLRGFTALSETQSPDLTIRMLNRYFSRLIDTIRKHRGIIVDFFGDALLVFFDPIDGPVGPVIRKALECAFEMQTVMTAFNDDNRSEGLPELRMGIGVNAGEVVVGNIGSETRAKYGIVGSAVNVTSRIQAKAEGGEVVVSPAVYLSVEVEVRVKKSFITQLKGIQDEVSLYVVVPIDEGG